MNAIAQNAAAAAPLWKAVAGNEAGAAGTGAGELFAGTLGQLLGGASQAEGTDGSALSLESMLAGLSPLLLLALIPQGEAGSSEEMDKQLQQLLEQHPELFSELLAAQGFTQWSAKVDELVAALSGEEGSATVLAVETSDEGLPTNPLLSAGTADPGHALKDSPVQEPVQQDKPEQAAQTIQKFLSLLQSDPKNPFVQQLTEDLQKLIAEVRPAAMDAPKGTEAAEAAQGKPAQHTAAVPASVVKPGAIPLEQPIVTQQASQHLTATEALSKLQVLSAKQGIVFEKLVQSAETKSDLQPAASGDEPESNLVFSLQHGTTAKHVNDVQTMAKPVSAQSFVQDMSQFVLKSIKVNALNGFSEARLSLTPEHLGQVDVKISLQNGQLVAQFSAQTLLGKEMIESQLSHLRSTLVSQGLQVEKIEVSQSPSLQSGMFHDGRHQQSSQQFTQQSKRQPERYEQGNDSFSVESAATDETNASVSASGFDVTA
ncbi:flagellar hook-length control protein FliK [Paenibacillus sp. MBLB4367]|uniref:flagellar hook-length control protein FliK n=1 Tax=Paenibacillus sp. MBLB4367 TaxID=3384767 RepID=UPI0039080000